VKSSFSITDAIRNIGYTNPRAKHTRDCFKKRIEEDGIDISHFNANKKKSVSNNIRYTLEEILIENSSYVNIATLKKRLVSEGVMDYKCNDCGNTGEWNGKPLSLQLDHANGINNDNRLENLRFLCPNCHSQTDTYAGKNNKGG